MLDWVSLLVGVILTLLRGRRALLVEHLLLRQQLAVALRTLRRPRVRWHDRLFWLVARRLCADWRRHLVLVQPETVLRWHRRGWRLFWWRRSRRPAGRPRLPREVRDLIRRLSEENRLWGTERLRGELRKLGLAVGNGSIRRYRWRPAPRPPSQTWRTFLANHAAQIWAADLFTVPSSELAERYRRAGHPARAVPVYRRVLAEDPTAEDVARALFRCYGELGDRPALVREYQLLRERLRRVLADADGGDDSEPGDEGDAAAYEPEAETVAAYQDTLADPAALPGRYCDPLQVTDKAYNDACIWLDFTKNDEPPDLRLGVFGDRRVWNASGRESGSEEFYWRLLKVAVPRFAAGRWTHVAITWDGVNTAARGRAFLYLDGAYQGATGGIAEPFTWDLANAWIRLGTGRFVGLLDDLAAFDRPLTPGEIRDLYRLEGGVAALRSS